MQERSAIAPIRSGAAPETIAGEEVTTLPVDTPTTENGHGPAPGATERHPTTVVFVDVVDSTVLLAAIGDEQWAVLLERFQELFRRELAAAGGEEMDTAGDGLFAIFDDAEHALAFACSLRAHVRALDLRLRVGVHTGSCWVAGDKCAGLDVNIGARIADAASQDEILVSAQVRSSLLDEQDGFEFHERGQVELKGVPGRWPLYAVDAKGGVR